MANGVTSDANKYCKGKTQAWIESDTIKEGFMILAF